MPRRCKISHFILLCKGYSNKFSSDHSIPRLNTESKYDATAQLVQNEGLCVCAKSAKVMT